MSFVKRKIDLTFTLGKGAFGLDGFDTVKVSGARVKAHIVKAGGATMGEARLEIYGLAPSLLNQLSALTAFVMIQRKNEVSITAGDDESGMGVVFVGTITQSWADLNSAPDSILRVVAVAGMFEKLKPIAPNSYPGRADVAVIMQSLATQTNLKFENNGVSSIISTQYLPGTGGDQVQRLADACNINAFVDNGTLAIWPKGGSRGGLIPLISPDTGMIGYPAYNGVGISVSSIFNPTLNFGGTVEVKSSILNANGKWFVAALSHNLEAELPHGEWFTNFQGTSLDNINAIAKPQ